MLFHLSVRWLYGYDDTVVSVQVVGGCEASVRPSLRFIQNNKKEQNNFF